MNWANTLYLFLALLSLLLAYAAIHFGNRLAKVKEADANVRIEKAKETAAEANKKTKMIENENIRLRGDLESAITESRRGEAKLASEQTRLAHAQKELAQAEQERAEAQLALEKTLEVVRERQTPRTLTGEQRSRLVRILRGGRKGNVRIECPMGDGEAIAYAQELEGLLKAAGWTIKAGGISHAIFSGPIPKGVLVLVPDAEKAPQFAAELVQALADIGIDVGVGEVAQLQTDVVLRIGTKP